ncbi:MAG: hypothetical protein LBC19_13525 [Tannerella sp.]|jgi:hypothetical protein|nr:hypothetical protein [Tannerella sp.]
MKKEMDLWQEIKSLVREYETEEVCLIFDDTIVSKPCTDENDRISWHWNHSKGRNERHQFIDGFLSYTVVYSAGSIACSGSF